MRSLRVGALVSGGTQYFNLLFALLKLVILSRILTPADFGAFAIALSLVWIVLPVRIFGTIEYIVSKDDFDIEDSKKCRFITYFSSISIALIYIFFAPVLAILFGSSDLHVLLPIVASSFFVTMLTLQAQAIMRREMRFVELSIARLCGGLTETALAMSFAFSGFGGLSLGYGFIAGTIATALVIIAFEHRVSIFDIRVSGLAKILKFGAFRTMGAVLDSVGQSGAPLLLGLMTNTSSVGFFNRGQRLVDVFRQGVETSTALVTEAWFASTSRADPAQSAERYTKVCKIALDVSWPFYVFLFFTAPTIVPLLLGDQWLFSVPITQAIAIGGLFTGFSTYGSSMLVGRGRVRKQFEFSLISQIIRFAALALVLMNYGLIAFAWTLAASRLADLVLISWFLRSDIGLRASQIADALLSGLKIATPIALLNYALLNLVFGAQQLTFLQLAITCGLNGVVWLLCVFWLKQPIAAEITRLTGPPLAKIRARLTSAGSH